MHFKQALRLAANEAQEKGTISDEQHAQISEITDGGSVNRGAVLQHFAQHALGASGAIDWSNLISQLQTLLPFILQIIALFQKKPA